MRLLFLHSNQPDYLAESLFHGLRKLLGKNCVDVPRYDSMYSPLTNRIRAKLRGYGFTIYGLLEDIPELSEERFAWQQDLSSYDLIVIANIWHQWETVIHLSSVVDKKKLVILDGEDMPAFFPYASIKSRIQNSPWAFLTPLYKFKYFKRELCGEGANYGLDRFVPSSLRQWIPLPKNAISISFSIPEEKIWQGDISDKTKTFARHIVDPEVAAYMPESSENYLFSTEADYYDDLRKSRFGITTKRAGWDCMRHYELAANGCVLCFKNLDLKPITCAPHGLNELNCITYHNYNDLKEKIAALSEQEYLQLQERSYEWIMNNTTLAQAKKILEAVYQS